MHGLIVIQNRNDAKYLPTVINSVLAQTDKRLTLVGIDAGSTDNSVVVYEAYGVPWVDCDGLNQAASCNAVIRQYWGEPWDTFTWINADDWFAPEFVAAHFAGFAEHPETEISCSNAHIFYQDEPEHGIRPFVAGNVLAELGQNRNHICQPSVMIRRQVFEKIGLLDDAIRLPFDYEYWRRAQNAGCVFRVLETPTVWRRKMRDCFTSTASAEICKEMLFIHELYKDGATRKVNPLD